VSQSHISEGLGSEDDKENGIARNGDRDTDTVVTASTAVFNTINTNTTTPVDTTTAESINYTTTATTTTTVTSKPDYAPRSGSPAGSSSSGTSSVEHFYHSDEEPR